MILPDVRGLYRFYEELALRFAERGYAAVAIDYFGRTRRRREARRRLRVPAARRADDAGGHPGGHGGGSRMAAQPRLRVGLHRRLLPRRPPFVAGRSRRPRPERSRRLLRTPGCRPGRQPGPGATSRSDRRADPRPASGRRPGDLGGRQRSVQIRTRVGRRRARAGHVRRRPAQLLRPEARELRRCVGGCLAKDARLHRATPQLTVAPASDWRVTNTSRETKRAEVRRTSARNKSEGPGRQSGPRSSFLSRAGYGLGSRPPGVGPTMGGIGEWGQGEERCRPSFTSIVFFE